MNKILSILLLTALPFAGVLAQGASKYGKAKTAASRPKVVNAKTDTTGKKQPATAASTKSTGGASKYANIGKAGSQQASVGSAIMPGDTTGMAWEFDTILPNSIGSTPAITLRNNYGVDKGISSAKERTPLAYEHLRDEDAMYSQFIWREINAKEKINQSFMYGGKDEFNRDQKFFSILVNAVKEDSVQAFDPQDDRFTTPLSVSRILNEIQGKLDTVYVDDPITNKTSATITRKASLSPDSVYTFRVKEQWIFDRESSRMFTRIIGIAPVAKVKVAGSSVDRVLFWVYYPDLRATLAKYDVYNPKNSYGRMTWEDVFEGRMFNSYVIKSTLDNTNDSYLKAYIKDPLFRLYEGENIKEKIFNYEQNLWQY